MLIFVFSGCYTIDSGSSTMFNFLFSIWGLPCPWYTYLKDHPTWSVFILLWFLSPHSADYPLYNTYIYIGILRTWFFTGSQSPKSQMQAEGPCFPSSAAQRSWNSAQQQNSDASGWQLQQGMYCWPQQWKDRPRSYGTKLLSTTHLRKGCLSLKWLWRRACSSPEWKLVITW